MASIPSRTQRGARGAWRPRSVWLPVALLVVAPALGLIFAAVYLGMRARISASPRTAADAAAAPVPTAELEQTPSRTRVVLASLRPTSGRALTGAAAIVVAVLLASTAAAGSYAFLNSRQSLGSGGITLTAGTLGITVNGTSSASAVALPSGFSKLLPGDYFSQTITLANSGNTPGVISARLAAAPAPYEVRLSTTACPSTGYTTATNGTVLSTADAGLGTLAAGASATGCLQIGLGANAPASGNSTASVTAATASASFALTVTSTQPSS